ncbi:unnamed protein product [Paramecium sonneborni]|uniref:EF-hand domain-containing protein n=1 Tax=Paramecium sonneborni TaxID=65129 RepID=A0A8S1RRS2_9CILI|nr:unnamed protein product [Paramecium sonneborni]
MTKKEFKRRLIELQGYELERFQIVERIIQLNKNGQLNFNEFKRFINRTLRLGLVQMKYLNKKICKIGKIHDFK